MGFRKAPVATGGLEGGFFSRCGAFMRSGGVRDTVAGEQGAVIKPLGGKLEMLAYPGSHCASKLAEVESECWKVQPSRSRVSAHR